MPDRVAGRDAVVYADLPGLTGPVTLAAYDPTGYQQYTTTASAAGGDRYTATIPASQLTRHGLWALHWSDASRTEIRPLTVGPAAHGLSLWDLRLLVASRENSALEGVITEAGDSALVDADLIGGPKNYRGRWVLLHPEAGVDLAGVSRRVSDFNGSALVLSRPFPGPLRPGDRYALFTVDPREIGRAIAAAVGELASRGRVPTRVTEVALTVTNQEATLTVPAGLTHVDALFDPDGVEIAYDTWEQRPGRRIVLTQTSLGNDDTVTVSGVRDLTVPQFEDSIVDIAPTSLVARAALELLATRAGGAGVDVREHLRRQLMAQQEFEASLRYAGHRLPPGARPVLD